MRRLVPRYIHQTEKDMKMDGVSEDDLLEIKQDISSLRFELREDRRREIVRSSSHVDGVKREILRSLSSVGRPRPSFTPTPETDLPSGMSDELSAGVANEAIMTHERPHAIVQSRTPSVELSQAHVNYIRRRFPMYTQLQQTQQQPQQPSHVTGRDLEKIKSDIINVLSAKLDKQFSEIVDTMKRHLQK